MTKKVPNGNVLKIPFVSYYDEDNGDQDNEEPDRCAPHGRVHHDVIVLAVVGVTPWGNHHYVTTA